jgi:hypothetical protein
VKQQSPRFAARGLGSDARAFRLSAARKSLRLPGRPQGPSAGANPGCKHLSTGPTVACVLRSGGDYGPDDVRRLRDGVEAHLPGARFVCLSDVDVPCERIPLRHDWPGWWSKLELCAPWVHGDAVYLDLDTIITGDLSDLASLNRLAIMRDVLRPDGLQSSCMFLPEADRAPVWKAFTARPESLMQAFSGGGDQAFLESLWLPGPSRIQDLLPGQLVSFKKDVRPLGRVPDNARAVIFHGLPRPRDIGWKI